jgi:tetratricopeptide (TPR) repeat protein
LPATRSRSPSAGKFERAARVFENLVSRAPESPRYFEYLRSLTEALGHAHGFSKGLQAHDRHRPPGAGLPWAKWAVQRARLALRVGEVDQAEKDANRALPILVAEGGTPLDIAEANSVLAFVGEAIGDYGMCVEYGRRALEAGGEGLPNAALYHYIVGVGHLYGGAFPEARAALDRGLAVAEARGDYLRVAVISCNLGLLDIRRGDFAAARVSLLRGLKWAERLESPIAVGLALDLLGLCAFEDGRDDEAAEYLGRARPATDASGESGPMIWVRIHSAMLELERGDPDNALAFASQAYELAAGSGEAPEQAVARALVAAAEAARGDTDGGLKGFSDAARGLQRSPARFEFGEVLRLWGELLADLGRRQEAAERLAAARVIFAEIGAKAKRARVEKALAALGPAP